MKFKIKSGFMKDKRVLAVISVVLSFVLWIVISLAIRTTGETTVSGVGVNINVQSGLLSEMGLSAIEGGEKTVDVVISGSRSVIGGVTAEDIVVRPSLSNVSGAGTYSLKLVAENASGEEFEIISVSPAEMVVKFDKYVDKSVPVHCNVTGDYNIPDDYLQEEIYTVPEEIIVTGPEKDIENTVSARVSVELEGEHTATVAVLGDIELLDAEGNVVEYNKNEVKMSVMSATVYVPIKRVQEFPLYFEYTNVPKYFDETKLNFALSEGTVSVAGDENALNKYRDILVGFIDMRDISLENSSFTFPVTLPGELINLDSTDSVRVDFDLEGYVETTFYTSQINIINVPKGYKVTPKAYQLAVTIIGPADVVNKLSAKDIIAQIDLSTREITQTGQYRIQADIILPGGQLAWAEGSYSVAVSVKKQ